MPTYLSWAPRGLISYLAQGKSDLPPHLVALIERLLTDIRMLNVWQRMSRPPNKPSDWDIRFAQEICRTLIDYKKTGMEPAQRKELIDTTVKLIEKLIDAIRKLQLDVDEELWRSLIRRQLERVSEILTDEEETALVDATDYPARCCFDIPEALEALRERLEREKTVPEFLRKPKDESAKSRFIQLRLKSACQTQNLQISLEGLKTVAEVVLADKDSKKSKTAK